MTPAERADRARTQALIKEIRQIAHTGRKGHSFKCRHGERHRGCRKDSY